MVMRRFPWKSPKLSDPSFKNFASAPNPYATDESPHIAILSKSTLDSSVTLTNVETQLMASGSHISPAESAVMPVKKSEPHVPAPLDKGPMKLLGRLSPKDCRRLIGRMLDLNPKTRATMQDIWNDIWFNGLQRCEIAALPTEDGTRQWVVRRAGTHSHVLVGPRGEDVSPSGTSIKRPSGV
jgi:serine/threonine protein kinase